LVPGVRVAPPIPLKRILLHSARAKHLGHLPKGFVEFHILIDAFDCPTLWASGYHPAVDASSRVDRHE
jgi:hypothetical protein